MNSCVIYETMNIIGKKWSLLIIFELHRHGPSSFNELKRQVKYITPKMLSRRLDELEEDGLVERRVLDKPLRTTLSLTPAGKDFVRILKAIKNWSLQWSPGGHDCVEDCRDCSF
ncbi:helix-turn-helix transcriptional regulator [Candidatus Woesearchaeota archaeon]|nr:helix-turn-helix transcriptional regulator [Candidatus Woesearchaeota archaeon]